MFIYIYIYIQIYAGHFPSGTPAMYLQSPYLRLALIFATVDCRVSASERMPNKNKQIPRLSKLRCLDCTSPGVLPPRSCTSSLVGTAQAEQAWVSQVSGLHKPRDPSTEELYKLFGGDYPG